MISAVLPFSLEKVGILREDSARSTVSTNNEIVEKLQKIK